MLNRTILAVRVITLVLITSLWGCNGTNRSPFTMGFNSSSISPISSLSPASPETVSIAGKVIKHIPLLNTNAYQLEDDTGIMVVVSTGRLPAIGSSVTVRGQLRYESIPIQGQELGEVYLVELDR